MMFRMFVPALAVLAGGTALFAQTMPSFELSRDAYPAYSAMSIAQGDFNGDGKADVVEGGGKTPTTITLRLGNGDGTFQAPIAVGQADSAEVAAVAAADMNGDGKLDVVALCIGGTFDVFYGNGDGTFQQKVSVATMYSPLSMTVGNYYGDGMLGVAVGDENGNVEVYKSVGGGSFSIGNTVQVSTGAAVSQVKAGDMNDDGVVDLGVLTTKGAYVLWGDNKGGFTPVLLQAYSDGADLNVNDLNQDGKADILVSYGCSDSAACAGMDVFYAQGNGKTMYRHLFSDGSVGAGSSPWAADVNGDGIADVVEQTSTPSGVMGIFVWLGHADGSFQQTAQQFISAPGSAGGLVPGDWNRDGMIDFAQTQPGYGVTEFYINGGERAPCATSSINQTVTVCVPVDGAYVPSPVMIEANAYDMTPVTALQEYVDYKLVYSKHATSFSTSLEEALGPHSLVTKAWDAQGNSYRSDRNITVFSGAAGVACPAALGAAAICLPEGTSGSPVHVLANGYTPNVPTAAQLYVDGKLVVNQTGCVNGSCSGGTSYVDSYQNLTAGTHDLVFKLWDAQGKTYVAQKTVTVN